MKNWWNRRSGPVKVLLVLAALLALQVCLVFATPALTPSAGEGWGIFGLVLWEMIFSLANIVAIFITCIWWQIASLFRKIKLAAKTHD